MAKDIELTLYDVFGYIFPGLVLLAAITIYAWSVLFPLYPLQPISLSLEYWVTGAVLTYFLGHMVQAMANWVDKILPAKRNLKPRLSDEIIARAKAKAGEVLGVSPECIADSSLYSICEETIVQYGLVSDRDVYRYREGFYRGLTVSLFFLTISLVVRALIPGASIFLWGSAVPIGRMVIFVISGFILVCMCLSYNRFRRFTRYRVDQSIVGFLVLASKEAITGKKGD